MPLTRDDLLLNERYRLLHPIDSDNAEGELWGADDQEEYGRPNLLKAWSFTDARPDDVQRALWDAELRTLYQMRSTPGSEDSLLQLQDVGIDYDHRCFVMVFSTPGLSTLASVLGRDRADHAWLSGRTPARRELWQMFGRLAEGLTLLHEQQVIHRAVSPSSVFLNPGEGPESCRLGGFEWSVRLGRPAAAARSLAGWETAPEVLAGSRAVFGPDADWFAFGMLVARTLLPIDRFAVEVSGMARYRRVVEELGKTKHKLTPLEQDFIGRMIAEDPALRPRHRSDIVAAIREIVRTLQDPPIGEGQASRHIVVIDPKNRELVKTCLDRGLREMLNLDVGDSFDPLLPEHVSKLQTFLFRDFNGEAVLAPIPKRDQYVLSGRTMHLRIGPDENLGRPSWQVAFCKGANEFFSTPPTGQVTIPANRIEFFSTRERRSLGNRLTSAPSWDYLLPKVDRARERRQDQERFAEFVRATNQIDVLIRDAEVFRCRVVDVVESGGLCTEVTVREIPREHEPLAMFRTDGGMAAFLLREKDSGKDGSNLIYLSAPGSESIVVNPKKVDPEATEWELYDIDLGEHSAILRPRTRVKEPPKRGDQLVVRTKGLGGQVMLIQRRKEAIAKLAQHTYLLESLSAPGQVLMDSGPVQLPYPLARDIVDDSKLSQIKKILGVRPIYTVQGPPGTGKTHMVAWLLREILDEDPVAQILITAQAHPAVDVLRAKVEKEAFKDMPRDQLPLAIRLRRTSNLAEAQTEPGSEYQVTGELLQESIRALEESGDQYSPIEPGSVQEAWLAACRKMLTALRTQDAAPVKEFRELVKRSASITYSTTGDGDLAALAGEVSYDWAIVEEAGKAHGFELALPLYLGHRWLLIGDPKQLPPFRIEDYEKAVADLDTTMDALESLDGAESLLDRDFLQSWRERTDDQRKEFSRYCKVWLRLFQQLHHLCAHHEHDAGLLTGQHRMHPDIGELVSQTYYGGRLEHYTQDPVTKRADAKILHSLTAPVELKDKAVVWLDLPWAGVDSVAAENTTPKYRNPAEARALGRFLHGLRGDPDQPMNIAVLSPYAQQVGYLLKELNTPALRKHLAASGLRLAPDPRRSRLDAVDESRNGFFTVDSFQGNQAEIIAVSLVRNNTRLSGDGLGFLVESPRMNVLLSRAERLLILVGSWAFFQAQVSHVSRDPEEQSQLKHLASAIDHLQKLFDAGRAVRIPAETE